MIESLPEHECVDPTTRDFRGREDETFKEIVRGDKTDIESCDCLLAYCPKPSFGTAMEVFFAWQLGKLVIVVNESPKVSPWIRYHASIIKPSIAEAVEYLKK